MKSSTPDAAEKPTPQEARRQRLAQALRDNLRRRKGLKTPDPVKEDEA
jgi:hypothetical protein